MQSRVSTTDLKPSKHIFGHVKLNDFLFDDSSGLRERDFVLLNLVRMCVTLKTQMETEGRGNIWSCRYGWVFLSASLNKINWPVNGPPHSWATTHVQSDTFLAHQRGLLILTCGSPLCVWSKHWHHSSMQWLETLRCLCNGIFHRVTWQQGNMKHIFFSVSLYVLRPSTHLLPPPPLL